MKNSTRHLENNPFPGLRSFRSDESHLFFGREDQAAALLQLLRQNRFLAVVGASGSGKSSLVRAGLIPELHGGTMASAGSSWETVDLRPGGNPFENLARALALADLYDAQDPNAIPRLGATLSRSRYGLVEAIKQSDVVEPRTNVLVIVDQFEELFRFRQQGLESEEAATAFVNLLLTASAQEECPIYVTLTMRSDYLGDCAEISGLAKAVNQGEYLIPRLDRDQLRDAIVKPAGVAGATISPLVVQRLLNDISGDPDQLPVLQHALMRMWDFWAGAEEPDREIGFADIEATGGLTDALSQHADEVYNSLPSNDHRQVCQKLFKALTEKGTDNRGIRRPTRLKRLRAITATENSGVLDEVIEAYRKPGVTFLMPPASTSLAAATVVDISHESLMRVWKRLQRWVDDEGQSARVYSRLVDTARLHADGKAGLYHNPDLDIALAWREDEQPNEVWAAQYGGGFDRAMAFLDKSAGEAQRIEREAEEARQRELAQAKALAESQANTAALLKRFVAVIGAAFVLAIALAMWANKESQRASEAEAEARAAAENAEAAASVAENAQGRTWLANARILKDAKDEFGARLKTIRALGFEGFGRNNLTEAQKQQFPVLLKEGQSGWDDAIDLGKSDTDAVLLWQSGMLPQHPGEINSAILSPDGQLAVSCSEGETAIRIWDATSGAAVNVLEVSQMSNPEVLAFSTAGDYLALAGADQLLFWRVEGKRFKPVDTAPFVLGEQTQEAIADGAQDPSPPNVRSLAFSPDDSALAMGDSKGRLYVWRDWRSFQKPPGTPVLEGLYHKSQIHDLEYQPGNGRLLASVGAREQALHLFDTETFELIATLMVPERSPRDNQTPRLQSMSFSPNGRYLAAGGDFVPVTLWNVEEQKLEATLLPDEWAKLSQIVREDGNLGFVCGSVDFSADGRRFAIAWTQTGWAPDPRFYKSTVSVFDCDQGMPLVARRKDVFLPSNSGGRATMAPNGERLLMTVGESRRLQLWDLQSDQIVGDQTPIHSGPIGALRFSPDGTLFASGDQYGIVRIWRARTGQLLHLIDAHVRTVTGLCFGPRGRRLFSISHEDATLAAWDTESGNLLNRMTPRGAPFAVELAPDNESIVVDGWGHRTQFVDMDTLQERDFLVDPIGHRFKFSPDGQLLVSYRTPNDLTEERLAFYAFKNGWSRVDPLLGPSPLHSEKFNHNVAFSPDGLTLAISYQDGVVQTWNREPGNRWSDALTLRMPGGAVNPWLAFGPSGKRLFSGDSSGTVSVWDATSGDLLRVLHGPSAITSIAISPDGRLLVTGSDRGILQVWSITDKQETFSVEVEGIGSQDGPWQRRGSFSLELARSRRLVFSAGQGAESTIVQAWHLQEGRLTPAFELSGHESPPSLFALSQDERFLASATWNPDGRIILWDLETNTSKVLCQGGSLLGMAFSPDGKTLAARRLIRSEDPSSPLDVDGEWPMDFYDTALENQKHPVAQSLPLYSNSVGIAFTPDGSQLFVTSVHGAGAIAVLDFDQETRTTTLSAKVHGKRTGLAMSRDGRLFSACSINGNEAGLWDTRTLKRLGRIPGTAQWNFTTAFSPDGSLVAYAGGGEFKTKVYRTSQSGELVGQSASPLQNYASYVSDMAFDSDGRTLVMSRNDGRLVVWRLPLGEPIVDPWKYLEVVELDEAAGQLKWRASESLDPQPSSEIFAPIEERYLPILNNDHSALENSVALFTHYLENQRFRAAHAVAMALEPAQAEPLLETLTTRLTETLIRTSARGESREAGPLRHLASQLFKNYQPELHTRLRLLLESADWEPFMNLLTTEFPSVPVEERTAQWESLLEGLNLYAATLIARLDTLDAKDPSIPPRDLLIAATLCQTENAFSAAWRENLWSCARVFDDLPSTALLLDALEKRSQSTLLPAGATWSYFASATLRPDKDWNQNGFTSVAHWKEGPAPLGYGGQLAFGTNLDNFRTRDTGQMAYFFRKEIEVHADEKAQPSMLNATLLRDDGLILYLDGKEILRLNMPEGEVTPETRATRAIAGEEKEVWVTVPLPDVSPQPGRHLLAAEIHQAGPTSSDILFDLSLAYPPDDPWRTDEHFSSALTLLKHTDPNHELFPWVADLEGRGATVENREAVDQAFAIHVLEFIGDTKAALQLADRRLGELHGGQSTRDNNEAKYWLAWKIEVLRSLGRPQSEIDAVSRAFAAAPPRPAALDPKQLDLSDYYNASLYAGFGLQELPLTFEPLHGVTFDMRGVIQLNSGKLLASSGNSNETPRSYNEISNRNYPDRVDGIPVNQTTEAIHFLMSSQYGRERLDVEVAHFRIDYGDGTSENVAIYYPNDIADWVQSGNTALAERSIGWRGNWNNGAGERVLSEVIWHNPHPDKTITTIDFVSGLKACAPFLVGITLE